MTGQSSSRSVLLAFDGMVITAAGVEAFDCPLCGDVRDLVVPDCGDGAFGGLDECPDRACAECGFALAVGSARERDAGDTGSRERPARQPQTRRAQTRHYRRAG